MKPFSCSEERMAAVTTRSSRSPPKLPRDNGRRKGTGHSVTYNLYYFIFICGLVGGRGGTATRRCTIVDILFGSDVHDDRRGIVNR